MCRFQECVQRPAILKIKIFPRLFHDNAAITPFIILNNYSQITPTLKFVSSLVLASVIYLLTVGVQIIVALDHTQLHAHSVGLLWTSDQPVSETSI